jgi:hypothetical protein
MPRRSESIPAIACFRRAPIMGWAPTISAAFARGGAPGWPSVAEGRAMRLFGAKGAESAPIDLDLLAAWDGVERR